jgi:tetratricopeptide (TPR) repeat protein
MDKTSQPPSSPAAQAAAHHAEGIRLASAGQLAEAVQHFQRAVQFEPQNPVWHFNAGLAGHQLNHLAAAIESYQKAVGLKPDFFEAWDNLGAAYKAAGQLDAAVTAGQKATMLRPQAPGACLNLGNALKALGDLPGAEAAYRRALALEPANPKPQLNLANTLREAGRLPEAIDLLRQVVGKNPRLAEAHRDLAFALLISGALAEGWAENEWRWETEEMRKKRRTFDQPSWRGENFSGRTLFVYTEQGFGDAIQFVRFIRLAAERGGHVILECQPALKRLLEQVSGVSRIVVRDEPLPPFDYQVPLLSLPNVLGITLESIPNPVPYLKPSGTGIGELPPANDSAFRIGLVWAGNPAHQNDHGRSLPFRELEPLLGLTGISLYSLQIGKRVEDLRHSDSAGRIFDLSPRLTDFSATAALIDQLDLIISVDTAVAHLAGALAKPVWLLLPYAPDWRWLLGRADSPWYPTMRLFRQPSPGQWAGVIRAVVDQLAERLPSAPPPTQKT